MLDENICRKCKNGNAPPSQSSCWACKDNDLFSPIQEQKIEIKEESKPVEFACDSLELKPCPFCGSKSVTLTYIEPHKHEIVDMPDYDGSAFVECDCCSASITAETVEAAVKVWNERYTQGKAYISRQEVHNLIDSLKKYERTIFPTIQDVPARILTVSYEQAHFGVDKIPSASVIETEIAEEWLHRAEKNNRKVIEVEKKLEETTAMLNAAILELGIYKTCATCKFMNENNLDFCRAEACNNGDQWKWRGLK